ncbi:MAG: hypothetical protein JWO69_716 [Thermoleophilia bacterium]|nr:hypothetical protein [Thermoleophilia bacterium]
MSSLSGASMQVLKSFIAGANAQYRAADLGEYQMKVDGSGRVTTPNAPRPGEAPTTSVAMAPQGSAAPQQAAAGAAAAAPSGAAPAGAAPRITDIQQGANNAFKLSWAPVDGAKGYGIYENGKLLGHVTDPSFAGQVAAGSRGDIEIDAVRADGSRTAKTPALVVAVGTDGKLAIDVAGGAKQAAAGAAATAPAAAAR